MDWYILKVQSNREESIREGLLRRVAIAGLGRYFGDVIVPTEKVTEFKGGKKRVIKRNFIPATSWSTWKSTRTPGTWSARRRGSAISPAGLRASAPDAPPRSRPIVAKQEEKSEKAPKLKINFTAGDG